MGVSIIEGPSGIVELLTSGNVCRLEFHPNEIQYDAGYVNRVTSKHQHTKFPKDLWSVREPPRIKP